MLLPISLLIFSKLSKNNLLRDHKGLPRLVTGLSVRVWSFRLSGCYPYEMCYEHHFLSFSSTFSLMLKIHPIIHFQWNTGHPISFATFTTFISQLFHSSFSFTSFSLFFCMERFNLFQNHGSRGTSSHFLIYLLFSP